VLKSSEGHVHEFEKHIMDGEKLVEQKESSIDAVEKEVKEASTAEVEMAKLVK